MILYGKSQVAKDKQGKSGGISEGNYLNFDFAESLEESYKKKQIIQGFDKDIFSSKYNKNTEFEISTDVQKKIMNANASFIIDIMAYLKISSFTITSLGIQLVNYFFIGKCFLNYDRFIYCAAAVMLALKIREYDHYRIKQIVMGYYNSVPKNEQQPQIMNDNLYQQIKNKICVAESKLLRIIEFELDIALPFDFLHTLFQNFSCERESEKERIYYATKIICFDTFRSYAPLLFSPQTIAVTSFIISNSQFKIEPSLKIPEKLREKYHPEDMTEEEAYERWLQEVSTELNCPITSEMIKDCLYVMNELLYLHYNPKEEDVKKFEMPESRTEESLEKPEQLQQEVQQQNSMQEMKEK